MKVEIEISKQEYIYLINALMEFRLPNIKAKVEEAWNQAEEKEIAHHGLTGE